MDDRYLAAWGLSGSRQDADDLLQRIFARLIPGLASCQATATAPLDARRAKHVQDDRKHPARVAPHTARIAEIEISESQASDQPKTANRRDRNGRHDRSDAD